MQSIQAVIGYQGPTHNHSITPIVREDCEEKVWGAEKSLGYEAYESDKHKTQAQY